MVHPSKVVLALRTLNECKGCTVNEIMMFLRENGAPNVTLKETMDVLSQGVKDKLISTLPKPYPSLEILYFLSRKLDDDEEMELACEWVMSLYPPQ
jgi:hypothetical protein